MKKLILTLISVVCACVMPAQTTGVSPTYQAATVSMAAAPGSSAQLLGASATATVQRTGWMQKRATASYRSGAFSTSSSSSSSTVSPISTRASRTSVFGGSNGGGMSSSSAFSNVNGHVLASMSATSGSYSSTLQAVTPVGVSTKRSSGGLWGEDEENQQHGGELSPVGDMVWPLILMVMMYVAYLRFARRRQQKS